MGLSLLHFTFFCSEIEILLSSLILVHGHSFTSELIAKKLLQDDLFGYVFLPHRYKLQSFCFIEPPGTRQHTEFSRCIPEKNTGL